MWKDLSEIISVDFNITGKLLIIYSGVPKKKRKKWVYNEAVHQLFIVINQTYNSDIREVLFTVSLVSLQN
jgi:hypothetical protein